VLARQEIKVPVPDSRSLMPAEKVVATIRQVLIQLIQTVDSFYPPPGPPDEVMKKVAPPAQLDGDEANLPF
jgi:hypothetical protein